MRQAGMKPKSHSSGTYWIRANAGSKGKTQEQTTDTTSDPFLLTMLYAILAIGLILYIIASVF
tara:strand:- start:9467 stop:9655 length:189 start_codon:yes stop_codon:yes gene_type:complete